MYDWGKTYPTFKNKYPQLKFTNEDVKQRPLVTEVAFVLKQWLENGKLYHSSLVDFHIAECINVLFQDYFTPLQILTSLIQTEHGDM